VRGERLDCLGVNESGRGWDLEVGRERGRIESLAKEEVAVDW
jgi:hypothetical protein